MLVLSRKREERIALRIPGGTVIPPEGLPIEVCIVDIRGDKVRVGLTAPECVSIHRQEVQDVIDRGGTPRQAIAQ